MLLYSQTGDFLFFRLIENKLSFSFTLTSGSIVNVKDFKLASGENSAPFIVVKLFSGELECYFWQECGWRYKAVYSSGENYEYWVVADDNTLHILVKSIEGFFHLKNVTGNLEKNCIVLEDDIVIKKIFFDSKLKELVLIGINKREQQSNLIIYKNKKGQSSWCKVGQCKLEGQEIINLWMGANRTIELVSQAVQKNENEINYFLVDGIGTILENNRVITSYEKIFDTNPFLVREKNKLVLLGSSQNQLICFMKYKNSNNWERSDFNEPFFHLDVEEIELSSGYVSQYLAITRINNVNLLYPGILTLEQLLLNTKSNENITKKGIRKLGCKG